MTALPLDLRQWETSAPEAWEDYRERCALVEFLGKVPRARAEEQAERITRERWSRGGDEAAVRALGPLPGAKREQSAPIRAHPTRSALNSQTRF